MATEELQKGESGGGTGEEKMMENSISMLKLSPEEERLVIRDSVFAAESQCKEGDTFYLITQRWWQHWLQYVNQGMATTTNDGALHSSEFSELACSTAQKRPPAIDNSDLINDATSEDSSIGIELLDTLVEGRDYVLLPEDVWKQLFMWYGGGPVLPRKVINSGLSQTELGQLTVEVYLLRLQLIYMPKRERSIIRISKKETIRELHRRACDAFNLDMEQISIWDYYGHRKHDLMNNMDKTLDDANIQMGQDILVELLGNESDTFGGCLSSLQENGSTSALIEPSKSSMSIAGGLSASRGVFRGCSTEFSQNHYGASQVGEVDNSNGICGVVTRGAAGGLTGLLNLGNTCFMNSAIQCLVHTPEFARYFRDDYHPDINKNNPLGMVGELALAFGELLRKLWAPGRTPISPRPFKSKLARFAPQFSGYNQHDSQELLAFLLDGLHEDLNRVKHKPYIKSKDADGRLDEEVADEYWANHIARNDSIIVDVCQGQYKSTLICPICAKVSVTFDPFMYLSLPLQPTNHRSMTVMVFNSDGTAHPEPCTVTVPKQGRCRDLIQAISNACSIKNGEKLLLAEIRGHQVHRFLEDPLILLSTIKDDDHLAAYKIQKLVKDTLYLQLIHRREERESSSAKSAMISKPFGIPLVSPISRDRRVTGADIQEIICKMLSPLERVGTLTPSRLANNTSVSESGAASDPSEDATASGTGTKSAASDSMDEDPSDPKIAGTLELPLQLVTEKNEMIDLSKEKEKTISLSSSSASICVFLDWSDKLLEKYETQYLANSPEVFKYVPATKKARTEPLSLYTCLEAFLREEPLVPEDMWYCPQCKERRQASKKLDLWRLPEVLVIHLKRFSYSRSMKHKLETFVNFPIHDFDLTNYVAHKSSSKRQLYELYALSNHYGGMGSGHYTAHIKMQLLDENRWYSFDDSHISPINEEDVKSAAAYVLFYHRVKGEDVTVSNGEHSYVGHNNILTQK
ncbi:ubiquitin carboxyl-terminal hydrolase 5-like isoform X1 [Papaver somniferum]|uniref:ubiquitin carboxyl-terminal hydrolase 5-like isoform X1 n=1 Tax=Papaver somniferum TaxID=3469 RepID=UPI000E702E82|nr:ubiquitin carboxyl-terminal hydrolase 5-like isoform X1 [Papaver somniferum]